jgi:GNAT superfamily N-acetyltransferase
MLHVRRIEPHDSLEALTDLLHRAYARLAALGFRYRATDQDVATTERRIAHGDCYLALVDQRVVGTVLVIPPQQRPGSCAWYARPDVAVIGQYAIEPELQSRGLGTELLSFAERRAADLGVSEVAVDTAENAAHLVAFYTKRGYRQVAFAQWDHTNYRSVILSKHLPARGGGEAAKL